MHNFLRTSLLALAVSALAGCSLLYDYAQDAALAQCASVANGQDRRDCEKRNGPSYDDYEARRQRLQDGKPG
ncbi:MAG: hypothetical protein EKK52_20035 [Burkholderiales bacterium]|nr:MAG: hypothetical protein EKK52_20035 [Burkholderiales bacterium]